MPVADCCTDSSDIEVAEGLESSDEVDEEKWVPGSRRRTRCCSIPACNLDHILLVACIGSGFSLSEFVQNCQKQGKGQGTSKRCLCHGNGVEQSGEHCPSTI